MGGRFSNFLGNSAFSGALPLMVARGLAMLMRRRTATAMRIESRKGGLLGGAVAAIECLQSELLNYKFRFQNFR